MMKSIRSYMGDAYNYFHGVNQNEDKFFQPLPWYMDEAHKHVAKHAKDGPVSYNLTLKLPDGKTQRISHEVFYKDGVEQTIKEMRFSGKNGVETKTQEKDFLIIDGAMVEEKSLRKVLKEVDDTKRKQSLPSLITGKTKSFADKLQTPGLGATEQRLWIEAIAAEPSAVENKSAQVGLKLSPIQELARDILRQEKITQEEIGNLVTTIGASKIGHDPANSEIARIHHLKETIREELRNEMKAEINAAAQSQEKQTKNRDNVLPFRTPAASERAANSEKVIDSMPPQPTDTKETNTPAMDNKTANPSPTTSTEKEPNIDI